MDYYTQIDFYLFHVHCQVALLHLFPTLSALGHGIQVITGSIMDVLDVQLKVVLQGKGRRAGATDHIALHVHALHVLLDEAWLGCLVRAMWTLDVF